MRIHAHFLSAAVILLSVSTKGQDKIYLEKEQKDGKVIEITEDKVRYKNPLNPGPVYSISRNKVLFVFSEIGNFLVLDKMEAGQQELAMIKYFLSAPANNKQDRIFTSQKKELVCDIVKEDETALTVNVSGIDMKLEKSTIALIVYKDGKHKLLCESSVAAGILIESQSKLLASLKTQAETPPATKAMTISEQTVATTNISKETPATHPVATQETTPPVQESQTAKPDTALHSATIGGGTASTELPATPVVRVPAAEPVKPAPQYAVVVIKANKQSSVTYTINDTLSGSVKPAMGKRLQLKPGQYNYRLDDKQGNIKENNLDISENDLGKEITISFPEINYALLKAKEMRKKKATADSLAEIKAMAMEALRIEHENHVQSLRDSLTGAADNIISLQTETEKSIAQIKDGTQDMDETFVAKGKELAASRSEFAEIKKRYLAEAAAPSDKEKREAFLKQLKLKEDKFSLRGSQFIENVQSGKEPMSRDLMVALNKARINDLLLFIPTDSINEKRMEGDYLLVYAVKKQLPSSVVQYLVDKGTDVNFFGKRFADNTEIYQTPLATACINGDDKTVKVLAGAKAGFVPPAASAKEKRHNLKYILSKTTNPKVITVLKDAGYDLNDGTEDMVNAMKEIEANMVKVEGGMFTMGCTEDQKNDCVAAETPAIQVSVKTFSIGKFEITRKQWIALMDGDNLGEFRDCMNCPVEGVTYDTAMAFLKKLNSISEKKYRLPTEAEWEYAARGGKTPSTTFRFAGSNDFNEVSISKDNGTGKPKPVGQKKPNDLGLYDMSGNVAEWCSDWYMERYYLNSTKDNPKGPEEGNQKVLRGGSWNLSSWSARVSGRRGVDRNMVNSGIGFRLVSDQ
jgi:formylglycine-generating enzyme required for sulfatase activity